VSGKTTSSTNHLQVHHTEALDDWLQRFWQVEDLPSTNSRLLSSTEKLCEDHFHNTHTRDKDGRYVVQIPWKSPRPEIGNSRVRAEQRLKSLEKRLHANPAVLTEYRKFMQEY